MLLEEDSVPVLPEEEVELAAALLAVESVPVLDSDEAVMVETDVMLAVEPVPVLDSDEAVMVEAEVMLAVALDEEPVPIPLVDPVPMLLVDEPYPMDTGFSAVWSAQMQGQLAGVE